MIRKIITYFEKLEQRKSCSHYWDLYEITPVRDRKGKLDAGRLVYKIRCFKCSEKQERSFWGIDRLQKLGRIQEGRPGWDAEEMAEIVFKGVQRARRGESKEWRQ